MSRIEQDLERDREILKNKCKSNAWNMTLDNKPIVLRTKQDAEQVYNELLNRYKNNMNEDVEKGLKNIRKCYNVLPEKKVGRFHVESQQYYKIDNNNRIRPGYTNLSKQHKERRLMTMPASTEMTRRHKKIMYKKECNNDRYNRGNQHYTVGIKLYTKKDAEDAYKKLLDMYNNSDDEELDKKLEQSMNLVRGCMEVLPDNMEAVTPLVIDAPSFQY